MPEDIAHLIKLYAAVREARPGEAEACQERFVQACAAAAAGRVPTREIIGFAIAKHQQQVAAENRRHGLPPEPKGI